MSERIERIKNAVEQRERCRARHVDGMVETFDLQNRPTAKRAYAWERWEPREEPRYTVVLGIPPINSARDAVKAAIVAKAREI